MAEIAYNLFLHTKTRNYSAVIGLLYIGLGFLWILVILILIGGLVPL